MTTGGGAAVAPPTRRSIVALAWPIVLANAAVPLLGIVDTAVIGNVGTVSELGAIALGGLIFNFAYWSFGFLRMGTTGFTAQAAGAGDSAEVRATLGRALLLSGGIGVSLVLLQRPVIWSALGLLGATPEVEGATRAYFDLRIWGAPASLGTFSLLGTLVGLGRTRHVLLVQLVLNGLNIALDIVLAGALGMGIEGVAIGTAVAEWTTLVVALVVVGRVLRTERTDPEPFWPWARIVDRALVGRMLGVNADIMVRTLFLLLGFGWFTNQGALFGDQVLAANHVLLQLITLSAYLLDGYAHATEIHVGRAVGTSDIRHFDAAVRSATELAAGSALALGATILVAGPAVVRGLTDLEPVARIASSLVPFAATYVVLSFVAFQLDGVFIGATGTKAMRNASVLSCLTFVAASLVLVPRYDNVGLWVAFVFYVVVRGGTLLQRYPRLRASIAA